MPEINHPLVHLPTAKAALLIRRPVAEIFAAFVDPEITTKFWFTKSSGRLEAGQRVQWDWEMYDASAQVDVTAIEENQRILVEWGEPGAMTTVEWRFTPQADNATFVQVTNTGFRGDADAIVSQAIGATEGFTLVLAGLKALLEHDVRLNLVADKMPADLGHDRVECEIRIQAPIEQVWTMLTSADHLAAWYAYDGADVDPRPGGGIVFRWNEHGTFHGRIEQLDPPSFLTFRYALTTPDVQPRPGNSTLVAVSLYQEGDGTRVRVVEQGFVDLDESDEVRAELAAASTQAWTAGLGLLRERAEVAVAVRR